MDTSSLCFFIVMGLALLCLVITFFGLVHMLWTWIDEYSSRLEWEAWKKTHRESFYHGPEKPVYWCKYKNRKM